MSLFHSVEVSKITTVPSPLRHLESNWQHIQGGVRIASAFRPELSTRRQNCILLMI